MAGTWEHGCFSRVLKFTLAALGAHMRVRNVFFVLGFLVVHLPRAEAQSDTARTRIDSMRPPTLLIPITVSATRIESSIFKVASPVLVVDSATIRRASPNGISDLFRNLPGVDVTGVGASQERIMIRGQRGQRILLAEDGLRMNNARRQQDFGEIPALVDVHDLARVEVVRGPASVLYGTDAIGGVVNAITLEPPRFGHDGLSGSLMYRHAAADGQNLGHVRVSGRSGRIGFVSSFGTREAGNYQSPAGTFGALVLDRPVTVNDVGVRDQNFAGKVNVNTSEHSDVFLRYSRYHALDAGFGYVDASRLGDKSGVLVRLLYPRQDVDRVTAGYRATALGWGIADRFSLTALAGSNRRDFDQQVDIPFGAPLPPTAGIAVRSHNYTDIGSYGARLELTKVVASKHTLVYGADWYLDHSLNTDSSKTTVTVFGPPSVKTSTVPSIPNANYATGGLFVQGEMRVLPHWFVTAGVRGQTIHAATRPTVGLPADRAGVTASNQSVVGNFSSRVLVAPGLSLVTTVGRAFRAPNLIERYFQGATPEGNGYQVASPNLAPETSLNVDVGFKFHRDRLSLEATWFSNSIHDGIRIVPLDYMVGAFPAFRNENVARLRDRGLEALLQLSVGRGFSLLGNATTLRSRNVDRSNPVGDSYGDKVGGELSWRDPASRVVLAWDVRHQGVRKDIDLGTSPVGAVLPAFTVHSARASIRLPRVGRTRPELDLVLNNLTNRLYAEASNTSFFRPEAGRSLVTSVRVDF